jgi:hypothetical protein
VPCACPPISLIIPESRARPYTNGRLYKKVKRFLEEQEIDSLIDIYIVTIGEGIVEPNIKESSGQMQMKSLFYPPKRFRSGRSVISKKQIEKMVKDQFKILKEMSLKYDKILVYARGSYLKSLLQASQISCVKTGVLLSEYELSVLKRKGILWMKMGLRMNIAFKIFSSRIVAHVNHKSEQLSFPM